MKTKTVLLLGLLVGALQQPIARAYDTSYYWSSNSETIYASSVTFPSSSDARTALNAVLNRWNENPSVFNFAVSWGDTSVSSSNSQSETWAESGGSSDPPSECLWSVYSSGRIDTADVVFYNHSGWSWSLGTGISTIYEYGGSRRPFRTTAIHEFGHALGLGHEDDEYNSMGEDWTHIHVNNGTLQCYPGEDAADGAVAIYGTDGSAGQDLSVTHWKYSGSDGDYSEHTKTVIYDSGGSTLSSLSEDDGDTRRYEVYPGQVVKVEFTLENNGRSSQTIRVGFYVSSNDNISTSDTLIDTRTPTLGRGDVYTITDTVTIPSTLTVGNDYYIGAYVDYDDTISEYDENNNSTYLPIRIVSP